MYLNITHFGIVLYVFFMIVKYLVGEVIFSNVLSYIMNEYTSSAN